MCSPRMTAGSLGGWDACFVAQNAPHQEGATIQHRLVVKHSKDALGDVYSPKISVRCKRDYRINSRVGKEGCNQDYLRVRVEAVH